MSKPKATIALGKEIRTLFDFGAMGAMPDRGLLDHFARGGEASEAAFATLVERHGPMVLRVCRYFLADSHLAEDAFQVTFLLLARRAHSIRDPDAIAGWLHRSARRVAIRARTAIRRRNDCSLAEAGDIAVAGDDPVQRDELCAIVHQEIDRLTEVQRLPIVLCALEGLSHEEAAQRLRWPVGTVKSRLVRGRRRLEGRLARRGLAPALALTAALGDSAAPAAPLPLPLAVSTTRAALQSVLGATMTGVPVAASISASTALLLQRELSAMVRAKVMLPAGAALAAGAAGILIGLALANPLHPHGRGIAPHWHKSEPPAANASFGLESNRGVISESPPVIAGGNQENLVVAAPAYRRTALGEEVERVIRAGVSFLNARQHADGSWADLAKDSKTGVTSLVTLALFAAGEQPESPSIRKSLEFLRRFGPDDLDSTYAIALQTMVFAAAEPERDRSRILANVKWLERAQFTPGENPRWTGSWTYTQLKRARPGDNSNTQFALLGLAAASEAGVPIDRSVWERARSYWETSQHKDGSWSYTPDSNISTASMTCAGISSLVMTRREGRRVHVLDRPAHAGLQQGIDWLATHFSVNQNFGAGQQWTFYYLYGLERACRLTGMRFLGPHDWYRSGAEELVRQHHKATGSWQGALVEREPVLAASFALLFLGSGRAPILINKLRHAPVREWYNDPDDVRNLVGVVSRDWKHLLTWQMVDSETASVDDLLRAPILFMSGHVAPEFTRRERDNLRKYVERGGVIFAEACCGRPGFDIGFRNLMKAIFPEAQDQLRPLPDDHPVWKARFQTTPGIIPLLAIHRGDRVAVIYSPTDLSCYWNQYEHDPANRATITPIRLGQNVIDLVTRRTLPPDKLSER
jgi:RNA polymerase sigma factor (sigma-70 family)